MVLVVKVLEEERCASALQAFANLLAGLCKTPRLDMSSGTSARRKTSSDRPVTRQCTDSQLQAAAAPTVDWIRFHCPVVLVPVWLTVECSSQVQEGQLGTMSLLNPAPITDTHVAVVQLCKRQYKLLLWRIQLVLPTRHSTLRCSRTSSVHDAAISARPRNVEHPRVMHTNHTCTDCVHLCSMLRHVQHGHAMGMTSCAWVQ